MLNALAVRSATKVSEYEAVVAVVVVVCLCLPL